MGNCFSTPKTERSEMRNLRRQSQQEVTNHYEEVRVQDASTSGYDHLINPDHIHVAPVVPPPRKRTTSSGPSKVVVAAIDFGTTFSGFAFSTRQDQMRKASKISLYQWNRCTAKAPTSVLFSPDKKFRAFGFEAESLFNNENNEEEMRKHYFFTKFKMLLYDEKKITRDTQLPDITGQKSLPAIYVFSSVIQHFRSLLEDTLANQFGGQNALLNSDIFWVLTVPAIWGLKAKCFMREAAEKAGIQSHQLALALEPEAASITCRQIPVSVVSKHHGEKVVTTFKEGSKYLVLDLGGGTIDITAHEILPRGGLKELHQASGGNWGGCFVNLNFLQQISNILGKEMAQFIRQNHPDDWLEVANSFEAKKCSHNFSNKHKVMVRLPASFRDVFRQKHGIELAEKLSDSEWKSDVSLKRDKLEMSDTMFRSFFEESVSKIVQAVSNTLQSLPEIDSILVVGGYAQCALVIETLKSKFDRYAVLVPDDPGLAVLKGAVMFGFDPTVIRTRVCRYTYGIPTQRPFVEGKDPEEKRRNLSNDRCFCDDIFDKHVELGTQITLGETREAKEYCTVNKDQKMIALELYASSEPDPKFVTDDSSFHVGMIEINLENKENDGRVLVRLNVSGTELEVEATEKATGMTTTATCHFLG